MISDAIKDRNFNSYGGDSIPNTFQRTQDPHQNKLTQIEELQAQGFDITKLGILTTKRGKLLILNNGSLLYKS